MSTFTGRPAILSAPSRLLLTLVEIGPRRLLRRLRHDIRQRLDRFLPPQLALVLTGCRGPIPVWRLEQSLSTLNPPASFPSQGNTAKVVSFTFLNQKRQLNCPFDWNDSSWPRLWQFHLHYFDWARHWLDHALSTSQWPVDACVLGSLLDNWIFANPPGRGDGWHSYTLSLRTRTWIQLFRHCPGLITDTRLQSLWQQLCWLQAHPEHCHGGNHWLENLTALAIGGLQFEGSSATSMYKRAMSLLQLELRFQLLADGGHQERSASYHLLILDRLVELAELVQAIRCDRPGWLLNAVERMSAWASSICLEGGHFPRFNDSASDACRPLHVVLASAQRYLAPTISKGPTSCEQPQDEVINLPDTGWTFLRPGQAWELIFKCGIPCPPHLAAHAHSDLLSFDLFHGGEPVIAEVGTSVYGSGPDRQFERGSSAHNSLQLGIGSKTNITWIEPVDVWHGFRAGRKAQPHSRSHGRHGSWLWAAGSHNGYESINAQHYRWLALRLSLTNRPLLVVLDAITAAQPVYWRGWWHFGSGLSPSLSELGLQWFSSPELLPSQQETCVEYLAAGFGQRQPSSVSKRCGSLPAGQHLLITVLAPQDTLLEFSSTVSGDGSLFLKDIGRIHWSWSNSARLHSAMRIPCILIDT